MGISKSDESTYLGYMLQLDGCSTVNDLNTFEIQYPHNLNFLQISNLMPSSKAQ